MGRERIKIRRFCDIDLVNSTRGEFARYSIGKSKEGKRTVSFSLNGESLANYYHDRRFRRLFSNANYVHADGMFIVMASRLLEGAKLAERIATTDWFHDVAKLSEDDDVTHYFLGADPVTIHKTVENVKAMYPRLRIVGYHHGYYDEEDFQRILVELNSLQPNIVWVGLGRPKQERVALTIRDNCNVGLIKTCGGLFDFLAGNNRRAPEMMQKIGMEWLFRLYLQPRRLFKRYLVSNYQSVKIVAAFRLFGTYRKKKIRISPRA